MFTWDICPTWQLETDLDKTSEVEVRFVAESAERTRVELEHRNLERHGPDWHSVADGIDGEAGWPLYLHRYADLIVTLPHGAETLMAMACAERADLAAYLATLTPDQWQTPSLCDGWTVKDVVGQMISYEEPSTVGLIRRFAKGWIAQPTRWASTSSQS